MDLSERPHQDAPGPYVKLNKAMASLDMKAVSRAMRDLAGIGYRSADVSLIIGATKKSKA